MRVCQQGHSRRHALVCLAVCALPLPVRAAPAQHPRPSATTRAAAWLLGDNLSLAALLNAGGSADASKTLFGKATDIAGGLRITLAPLPARGADKAASLAAVSAYVINGGGAAVGAALAKAYGGDHRTLYELSSRTNLLVVLYVPGDDTDAAGVVERNAKDLSLPANLWMPLVSAVRDKQSAVRIKDLVLKLHKDVADFLVAKVK